MNKKEIGIFGGSFNPIHKGHIGVAVAALKSGIVDEVYLMVSPENPLKTGKEIAPIKARLEMAELALKYMPDEIKNKIKVSDFETTLPLPSYTFHTLEALSRTFPDKGFRWIIGGDNLEIFDKWKNGKEILENYGVIIYPRDTADKNHLSKLFSEIVLRSGAIESSRNHILPDPALFPYSSTEIREYCKAGDMERLKGAVGDAVAEYIIKNKIYK